MCYLKFIFSVFYILYYVIPQLLWDEDNVWLLDKYIYNINGDNNSIKKLSEAQPEFNYE